MPLTKWQCYCFVIVRFQWEIMIQPKGLTFIDLWSYWLPLHNSGLYIYKEKDRTCTKQEESVRISSFKVNKLSSYSAVFNKSNKESAIHSGFGIDIPDLLALHYKIILANVIIPSGHNWIYFGTPYLTWLLQLFFLISDPKWPQLNWPWLIDSIARR